MRTLLFVWLFISSLQLFSQGHNLLLKSDSLFAQGVAFYNGGDYKAAIPLFVESDRIDKSILDSTSNRRDYSALWLGSCYYKLGNIKKATEITSSYKIVPVDRRLTVESDSLSNLALRYFQKGNYDLALMYWKQCANIEKIVLGEEHIWYGNTLNSICQSYIAKGNTINPVQYNYYITPIKEFQEAIFFGKKVLDIYKKNKKEQEYLSLLEVLNDCENKIKKIQQVKDAQTLFLKGVGELGKGNNIHAIEILHEVLNLQKQVNGEMSKEYAQTLAMLSFCYSAIGNYFEAIKYCSLMKNIYDFLGMKNVEYINSLVSLASYCSKVGNFNEAIQYQKEVIKHRNGSLLQYLDHSLLGDYYCHANMYEKAIQQKELALTLIKEIEEKEGLNYAMILQSLAMVYYKKMEYYTADQYLYKALSIVNNELGDKNSYYANYLINYAMIKKSLNNYVEAIRLGESAMCIIENDKSYNYKRSIDYINATSEIIDFYYQNKEYNNALNLLLKNDVLYKHLLLEHFQYLPTGVEQSSLFNKMKNWYFEKLPAYIHSFLKSTSLSNKTQSTLNEILYDDILLSKGLLLNSELEFQKIIYDSQDPELINKFKSIQKNTQLLNKLYQKSSNEYLLNTDSIEDVNKTLNRELLTKIKKYGNFTDNLTVSFRDVQNKLTKKDFAIEFVTFPFINDSIMYTALVLKKDWKSPRLIPLFEKKQLEILKNKKCYSDQHLAQLIWKPLEEYLVNIENIYFSPAGDLYNIAIESVPHWAEDCLMSDKWNFYRLSSTRQLVQKTNDIIIKQATLYGGLRYDTDTATLINDSKRYRSFNQFDEFVMLGLADSLNMRTGAAYLPATREEAIEINKTLQEKNISTTLSVDTIGTETSFKLLSKSGLNILHIATHGFYWTESEIGKMKGLNFLNDNNSEYVEDKALTRSGLLFSGANHALSGKSLPFNVDDGVLTAKEISTLDFRQLDLVVLSACQTGLGEITGDGVFGLQRGFKKAGANSLLMSLWKVDDDATRLLMIRFYKNLTSGKSKYESLREAQEYVRNYEVEVKSNNTGNFKTIKERMNAKNKSVVSKIKKYQDPYYWAAFILLDAI